MKKIAIYALLLSIGLGTNAQVTEIHTFSGVSGCSWLRSYDVQPCYYLQTDNVYYMYNWDFSLYKSITVTPPEGYKVNSFSYPSKRYVNNDDKLELFVTFGKETYPSDNRDSYCRMWLINEDGTVIKDFGSAGSLYANSYYSYNNETRINISKGMYNDGNTMNYSTLVYRCEGPGVVSAPSVNQANTTLGKAYPNPSRSTVTLPYNLTTGQVSEMHIYNSNGQLMKSIPIGPHFNEVMVDVSSFPSGLYIYECEGRTSKFVVN